MKVVGSKSIQYRRLIAWCLWSYPQNLCKSRAWWPNHLSQNLGMESGRSQEFVFFQCSQFLSYRFSDKTCLKIMWRVKEEKPNIDLICSPTCIKHVSKHTCALGHILMNTQIPQTHTHTHTPRHACTLQKFKIMVKNETNYSHHNSELYINLKFTSYWSPVLLKGRYNKLYGFFLAQEKEYLWLGNSYPYFHYYTFAVCLLYFGLSLIEFRFDAMAITDSVFYFFQKKIHTIRNTKYKVSENREIHVAPNHII